MYVCDTKLKIRVRYYRDLDLNKNVYPVYEKFNIEKRFFLDKDQRLEIARKVLIDKVSYEKAKRINDEVSVSKTTVSNYVKEFKNNFHYKVNEFEKLDQYKQIFICIDDTFRNLKQDKQISKFRFRVINIYQSRTDNKYINQVKICLSFKANNDDNQHIKTLNVIQDFLEKYYLVSKYQQQIIVCGDGAKFINNIAKSLNATLILDKFHCFQNIVKVFNFRKLNRSLNSEEALKLNNSKKEKYFKIIDFLTKNQFEKAYKIIKDFKELWTNKQKVIDCKRLINYLKFNENNIKNWNLFEQNPCLTETYVQQIIKSNFGNFGKTFSQEMFANLINIKAIYYAF